MQSSFFKGAKVKSHKTPSGNKVTNQSSNLPMNQWITLDSLMENDQFDALMAADVNCEWKMGFDSSTSREVQMLKITAK